MWPQECFISILCEKVGCGTTYRMLKLSLKEGMTCMHAPTYTQVLGRASNNLLGNTKEPTAAAVARERNWKVEEQDGKKDELFPPLSTF